MKATDLDFGELWKAYPFSDRALARLQNPGGTAAEIKDLVGGYIDDPVFENMCAVRMSRALNYGGWPVPRTYKHKIFPTFAGRGDDKKWYMIRVNELRNYLTRELGKPDVKVPSEYGTTRGREKVLMHQGIIIFDVPKWKPGASGHVTLWNHTLPSDAAYFLEAETIELWKIPTKPKSNTTKNEDGTYTTKSTAL